MKFLHRFLVKSDFNIGHEGRQRHGGHHEGGTSSPSPVGSTYTTASESGGPPTIESEPGNYLSASEDMVHPPRQSEVVNVTMTTSSDLTVIPQQTPHDPMARVSDLAIPSVVSF